ncbi:MAG TPA: hypothetical protein VFP52_09795, partial [Myxococcales bacterium]|nr:hypothetical protein [Myxococcales bacterium]
MRLMLVASMLAACAHSPPPPVTRDREVESLEQAVRWPDASTSTVMLLANAWLSTHRYAEGYAYFDALAPRRPLFEALAGVFQARSADG